MGALQMSHPQSLCEIFVLTPAHENASSCSPCEPPVPLTSTIYGHCLFKALSSPYPIVLSQIVCGPLILRL